ncbi:MAG TPA: hypothetical protein VJU86_17445 [Pyrinomonadaceae bacterium]|nr:hypothetical protein [Pyrinomonadaceae bacterium]
MLHIHNGDSSADTAAQSTIPGEHFAFREALITGPTPRGLSPVEWRRIRAKHLFDTYGVPLERCAQELLDQEEKLTTAHQHDEVVLWFEHDLFCQLLLIYLLNWFAQMERHPEALTLICIGEFTGKPNFKGLGELTPEELASLFPTRQPVTPDQLKLATEAWKAYTAPAPTEIENLLENSTASLQFLNAALQAHLRRFPSTINGLGSVESTALRLINDHVQSFADLFSSFSDRNWVYGFGDAQLWLALKRIVDAPQPMLRLKDSGAGESPERRDSARS